MIKIFKEYRREELEMNVNDWIKNCGRKIHDIQFEISTDRSGIVYTCCVITELYVGI